MPTFELRVEFAGLCLYVDHRTSKRKPESKVTILMPDARKTVKPVHVDGTKGEAHVGYVRFDLANVLAAVGDGEVPAGDVDDGTGSPPNEFVHRFDFEELVFLNLPAERMRDGPIPVPNFDGFTDGIRPIEDLLEGIPEQPSPLLMRTIIEGGTLSGTPSGKTWGLSPALNTKPGRGYSGNFAGFVVWTRELQQADFRDGLLVEMRKLDGSGDVTRIRLKPVTMKDSNGNAAPRITLKVANLCAHNPLEWGDFTLRKVVDRDVDFKWLYRVLEADPPIPSIRDRLAFAELPFPREVSVQAYGDEDCMGATITYPR
jgi:hypothetical protein